MTINFIGFRYYYAIIVDHLLLIFFSLFDLLFGNNSHIDILILYFMNCIVYLIFFLYLNTKKKRKINLFLFITLELLGVKLFLYCNRNVVSYMLSVLILYFVSMNFTRYFNFISNSLRLKNFIKA